MQQKSDPHIFSGMQRDLSISKHKAESLYDAKNIRFTARDGDTMLSITNEKGTLYKQLIKGYYLGHCVINDYVIIFTTKGDANINQDDNYVITQDNYIVTNSTGETVATNTSSNHYSEGTTSQIDRIYKVYDSSAEELYVGNLNFSKDHPIETLGVYENNNIQKVYWVDGLNQPRMINVCNVKDASNNDTQFDFVATLTLDEEISITRKEGSGTFAPGTIQYAFSYYNKYGKQSNIFYTTLLQYISYPDRGGSPEDKISNCFEINIKNLQMDFDYLRVYSIHRTSENAVPTVKRVIDIELSTVNNTETTFTDDGQIGDTIDPTELLYIGGEEIIAQTIAQKDNTLFLGNLELTRRPLDPIIIKDYLSTINRDTLQPKENSDIHISYTEFLKNYKLNKCDSSIGYYNYVSSFNWSSPGFKIREHYRLGVQFQHESGKWSEPVFIGDYTMRGIDYNNDPINPSITTDSEGNYELNEPCIKVNLNLGADQNSWLNANGYKRIRPVVVFPTIEDRLVLTQGMLCPTVFNLKQRRNSTPFSQASWFLRPSLPYQADDLVNSKRSTDGNWAEFRHFKGLPTNDKFNCEIQGNTVSTLPKLSTIYSEDQERNAFFVDQSIVTLHSPDIEWDNSFYSLDYTNWKLKVVGAINFTANVGDIDIQTSSPANKDGKGFLHSSYSVSNRSKYASKSLLAGPFWHDYIVGSYLDEDSKSTKYALSEYPRNYIVYPWHRSGSLNNDEVRQPSGGTRTAVLSKKKISNLKFSDFNTFFNSEALDYDISPVQLFSSDQISILKIPYTNSVLGNVSYYGNVDTLISSKLSTFKWMQDTDVNMRNITSDVVLDTNDATVLTEGSAPIRMKYKSTNHLVFSLKTKSNESGLRILPTLNNLNTRLGNLDGEIDTSSLFWLEGELDAETYTLSNMIKTIINKEDDLDNIWSTLSLNDLILKEEAGGILRLYKVNRITENDPTLPHLVELVEVQTTTDNVPNKYWYNAGSTLTFYKGVVGSYTNELQESNAEYSSSSISSLVNILQDNINVVPEYPYLLLGELYRDDIDSLNAFNGKSEDAIKSNLWIPAGKPVNLYGDTTIVEFTQGDTWYTRYDCLKTYPFTMEDENSIVEIGSFLCESRVNGDGRYDRNRGQISNLTMSPVNFNLLNPVYNNKDNFFNYRVLDEDYYTLNKFSNQITWSKEKQNAADIDLWTNITMANTFDLDGTMGQINALRTWKDTIYCFQDNAISIISFNPRVQIPTSDGVPIEISNSYKLEGKTYISDSIGCKNKQTIAITPSGIYFIDPNSKELYNVSGNQLSSISGAHGFSNWFKNNELTHSFYDTNRNDLYILNGTNCIIYSELLGQFTSFADYHGTPAMFNIGPKFYALRRNVNTSMYEMFGGKYNDFFGSVKPFYIHFISNADSSLDKIYSTIETRVDFKNGDNVVHNEFFDTIHVWNEYQNTGECRITRSIKANKADAKKKFRIWRINIPRDRGKRLDRIRNTWTNIKLFKKNPGNLKMELHDLNVQYFI